MENYRICHIQGSTRPQTIEQATYHQLKDHSFFYWNADINEFKKVSQLKENTVALWKVKWKSKT